MDTFFWSLILAAVTGLTFIAYKHPEGFSRNIYPPLLALVLFFFIGSLAAYMGGMLYLTVELPKEVAKLKQETGNLPFLADSIVKQYTLLKYGLGISLGVALYLVILKYLPQILDIKQQKTNESSKNNDA
jgi:hypothetical protein